ncbi:MAG: pyridoxal phosphate-dependent aminotransferase [Chloroflexi bacterium]|nr:pyridoxal phosphate-dependent aminotransferase [Chloroflexota bacterium]
MVGLTELPGLAKRCSALGSDSAFDLLAQVTQLRAEGRDIVSFGIGEPDFLTPEHIVTAAKRALDERQTRYGPSEGLPELRSAIAQEVSRTHGIPVQPNQVVVAPGAKPLIFYTMAALVNAGEEVVYPNPGFPTYESVIRWLGAKPVPMTFNEADGFGCDRGALERAVNPRTKLIILNSPNNPTGGMLSLGDLEFIAGLARRYNCWVLSDEIYAKLILQGAFASIASLPGMAERTIIMDGFSKSYAMTGWRLGYGVMHPELAPLLARAETNLESCTCTFTQLGGVAALSGPQDETERFVVELRERAREAVDALNTIPGIHCETPRGAFYVFPNVTGACARLGLKDADELAAALLHEAGVAVLPRSCFGTPLAGETEQYVRLSIATSLELIREGIDRIRRFVDRAAMLKE